MAKNKTQQPPLPVKRSLTLSWPEVLTGTLISVAIGALLYSLLLYLSYSALERAVLNADVIPRLLREVPSQSQELPVAPNDDNKVTEVRIKALLRKLDIAGLDELDEPLSTSDSNALIWQLFTHPPVRLEAFGPRTGEAHRTTLRLVAVAVLEAGGGSVLSRGGGTADCADDPDQDDIGSVARLFATAIANRPVGVSVANGPGAGSSIAQGLRDRRDHPSEQRDGTIACDILKSLGTSIYPLLFRAPQSTNDAELLDAALYFSGAISDMGWSSPSFKPSSENAEQVDRVVTLLKALMSEIRNEPSVRHAQYAVTLIRGAEQLAEIVLAIFIAFILWRRSRKLGNHERDAEKLQAAIESSKSLTSANAEVRKVLKDAKTAEDDPSKMATVPQQVAGLACRLAAAAARTRVSGAGTARVTDLRDAIDVEGQTMYTSAWPIRFGLAALPAIGFLGTVLGIMNALASADTIVRAQDRASQALAVVDIGGTLGLAFATTAIALLLGLILRVFADWIAAREESLISDLQRALVPLLDPAYLAPEVSQTAAGDP